MVLVLELAGVAAVLLVVWVLFRAARARPDERGLRFAAWGALGAAIVFAVVSLIDFGYVRDNAGDVGQGALVVAIVLGAVVGYRAILVRLRDRADGG